MTCSRVDWPKACCWLVLLLQSTKAKVRPQTSLGWSAKRKDQNDLKWSLRSSTRQLSARVLTSWREVEDLCQLTHTVTWEKRSKKLTALHRIIVWYIQYPTDWCQDANSIKAWKLSPIQRSSIVLTDKSHQQMPLLMLLILDVMGIRETWHFWRSSFIARSFSEPGPDLLPVHLLTFSAFSILSFHLLAFCSIALFGLGLKW